MLTICDGDDWLGIYDGDTIVYNNHPSMMPGEYLKLTDITYTVIEAPEELLEIEWPETVAELPAVKGFSVDNDVVTIIDLDDWLVIYRDGRLVWSDHPDSWPATWFDAFGIKYQQRDIDQSWLADEGSFPDHLRDVKFLDEDR